MAAGESAQTFREDDTRVDVLLHQQQGSIRDAAAEPMVNHIRGAAHSACSLKLRQAVAKLPANFSWLLRIAFAACPRHETETNR